ncbi:hypothetical protein [Blautia producta]|nr:hypothetical protein [Blautia producta]
MRNDVAHKGLVEAEDLESMAYDLILDLNTVSSMVRAESYDKFVGFIMTHEKMIYWNPNEKDTENGNYSMYEQLVLELFRNKGVIGEHFWKMLKNPNNYAEEISFYALDDLPEGYIDIPGMVVVLSELVRHENFWKALKELYKKYVTKTAPWVELKDFVRQMKNEYISELTGEAKKQCIEISRMLS